MNANDWIHYLKAFFVWASEKRQSNELTGDLLARLPKDLCCWLRVESISDNRLLSLMGDGESPPELCPPPEVQEQVLDWLKNQSGFAGDDFRFARWQLANCPAFKRWGTLDGDHELKFTERGVWSVVLTAAGEGEVHRVFAIFRPKPDQRHGFEVIPLNFTCDGAATVALNNAGKAIEYLLKEEASALLQRYLWGGERFYRSLGNFLHARRLLPLMEKIVKDNRVFLYMESPPGLKLLDSSLGAATTAAILQALLHQLAEETLPGKLRDFAATLCDRLSAELADICITGGIGNTGHFSAVEGVDPKDSEKIGPKIRAMVAHDDIFRAVVPKQNLSDSATVKRIKLRKICRADSFRDFIFWLVPLQLRWKVLNIGAVVALSLCLVFGIAITPDLLDRMGQQPRLLRVLVDDQSYSYDYTVLNHVPIRQAQKLVLELVNDPGDGWTEVEISALREFGTRSQVERLRAGVHDEWHPVIKLTPDKNNLVTFEYQHGGSEESGAVLLVTIFRKGRIIDREGRGVRLLSIPLKISIPPQENRL